jgi:hypothetical protein
VQLHVPQIKSGTLKKFCMYIQVLLETPFFWRSFKHGDGEKSLGYAGINVEPLCVELCNFVQCHMFVNYELVK